MVHEIIQGFKCIRITLEKIYIFRCLLELISTQPLRKFKIGKSSVTQHLSLPVNNNVNDKSMSPVGKWIE